MRTVDQRSPTRTETSEELMALAQEIRDVAAALDRLYERADTLSKPVFMTGWTKPLSNVSALSAGLAGWADILDAEAVNKPVC